MRRYLVDLALLEQKATEKFALEIIEDAFKRNRIQSLRSKLETKPDLLDPNIMGEVYALSHDIENFSFELLLCLRDFHQSPETDIWQVFKLMGPDLLKKRIENAISLMESKT